MAGNNPDTVEAGGIVFKLRTEAVPLGNVLLTRPLKLSAHAPESYFTEQEAGKPGRSGEVSRDVLFDADAAMEELLQSESVCSEMELLKVLVLGPVPAAAPACVTTQMNARPHASALTRPSHETEQLWRARDPFAVVNGSKLARRNRIVVIPLKSCEKRLYGILVNMHAEIRDAMKLDEVYHRFAASQRDDSSSNCMFATVDGAKDLCRIVQRAHSDSGESDVEVTVAEPTGTVLITISAAFTLSFTLNRIGQNREAVTPIEMLCAATLAMKQAVRAAAPASIPEEVPPRSSQRSGKGKLRKDKMPSKGKFMALMSEQFVKKVLQIPFDCQFGIEDGGISTRYVEAALSGVEIMDLLDSGESSQQEALPPHEFRAFKTFLQSGASSRGKQSETLSNSSAPGDGMVEEAVCRLWEMDGATRNTRGDGTEDRRSGSAMERKQAMQLLQMATAFAFKPASQALWDFAHRVHPDAARASFAYDVLIDRPNRGIAKDKAEDFETFLIMSILLSIALVLKENTGLSQSSSRSVLDLFRRSWGSSASVIASSLYILVRDLDSMSELSEEIEATRRRFESVSGTLVEKRRESTKLQVAEGRRKKLVQGIRARMVGVIRKTRELEKSIAGIQQQIRSEFHEKESAAAYALRDQDAELPRGIVNLPGRSGDGSPRPRARPVETTTTIPAIEHWWTLLWEQITAGDARKLALSTAVRSFCCREGSEVDLFGQVIGEVRTLEGPPQTPAEVAPAELPVQIEAPGAPVAEETVVKVAESAKATVSAEEAGIEVVDATAKTSAKIPTVVDSTYQLRSRHRSQNQDSIPNAAATPARIFKRRKPVTKNRWARPAQSLVAPNTAPEARRVDSVDSISSADLESELGKKMAFLYRLGASEEENADSGPSLKSWHREALKKCLETVSASSFVANAIPQPESLVKGEQQHQPLSPATASGGVENCSIDPGEVFRLRALQFSSLAVAVVYSLTESMRKGPERNKLLPVTLIAEADIPVQAGTFCCETSRGRFFNARHPQDATEYLQAQLRPDGVWARGLSNGTQGQSLWMRLLEPDRTCLATSSGGSRSHDSDHPRCPSVLQTTQVYATICDHMVGSAAFLAGYFSTFLSCTVLGRDGVMSAVAKLGDDEKISGSSLEAVLDEGGAVIRDGCMTVTLPNDECIDPPSFDARDFLFGEYKSSRTHTMRRSVASSSTEISQPESGAKINSSRTNIVICRRREKRVTGRRTLTCPLIANLAQEAHSAALHVASTGSVQTWNLLRLMAQRQKVKYQETMSAPTRSVQGALEDVMDMYAMGTVEKETIKAFDRTQHDTGGAERLYLYPGQMALVSGLVPHVAAQGLASDARQPTGTEVHLTLEKLRLGSLYKVAYLIPVYTASACFTLKE